MSGPRGEVHLGVVGAGPLRVDVGLCLLQLRRQGVGIVAEAVLVGGGAVTLLLFGCSRMLGDEVGLGNTWSILTPPPL